MDLRRWTGFFAPTPFIDETQGIPLARIVPFTSPVILTCTPSLCANDSGSVGTTAPFSIQAERVRYGSFDVTRRAGPLDVTATLFASRVHHPLMLWDLNIFDERAQLINAPGPIRTAGGEIFAVYAHEPVTVLLEYAYLHSTEISRLTGERIDSPLTPRHSGGLDVAWESDETHTRVALEVFYTGRQSVLGDPYRTMTPAYATIGLLISQRAGKAQLYLSAANLGDVRQTKYDPLLALIPGSEVRWTTDQWAPLDWRVINAGVRVGF
jgi:outer membrane receptor for ferrienterochelin and colicins